MIKINQESLPVSEEITLKDIWNVLAKHKVLVLAMPLASLLVATTYLLITPAIFESQAVIQIGQVGQAIHVGQLGQVIQVGQAIQIGQIETPAILVQRLREQYRVGDDDAIMVMPRISDIRLDKKGANFIILLAQDYSAKGAQKQLAQAVQALLAEHEKRYHQAMDTQQQRLQSRDKQMQQLKELIASLPMAIEAVRKQDSAQAAMLIIEKANLLTEMSSLESEYYALQLALSEIQSYPTKLLREPTLPERQVKPKSKLMAVFALTVGFLLGIMAAFVAEVLAKARWRSREHAV